MQKTLEFNVFKIQSKKINFVIVNGENAAKEGVGITENIVRSIPKKLCADIDLSKIKILKIFKWLKKFGVSDKEMLRTFNCGVGFCLISDSKNIKKISSFFPKQYQPYTIGSIVKNKRKKIYFYNKLKW